MLNEIGWFYISNLNAVIKNKTRFTSSFSEFDLSFTFFTFSVVFWPYTFANVSYHFIDDDDRLHVVNNKNVE